MKRVVFIPTFGRPGAVITFTQLRASGYTGDVILLCSDDDLSLPEYQKIFGSMVHVFRKQDYVGKFDIADNQQGWNVVVFARNAINDIAKEKGVKEIIVFDDDYTSIEYKVPTNRMLYGRKPKNLDNLFDAIFEYLHSARIDCFAMGQGGDYIGGIGNKIFSDLLTRRKLMNTFFYLADKPMEFLGRINEDVNTYVEHGRRGKVFITFPLMSVTQNQTQSSEGGLTDFYLETRTYRKSFYTVLFQPSSVKVKMMGETHKRLHHSIKWVNTVPMIISGRWKNAEN